MRSDGGVQIAVERVRKGSLKMYGLAIEIREVWDACGRVRGDLMPDAGLVLENLDDVVVALDHALVTIRTLDLEVFEASNCCAYRAARNDPASRLGRTVQALTAPRNNAVHHADVVDPDVGSAAGPMPGAEHRYLINPRWKSRRDLPARMFEDDKGRYRNPLAQAYDDTCAGVPILDTLFDAFAFFEGLAPQLARRQGDGSLEGFPLPPYDLALRYRRLAPGWPAEYDWHQRTRQATQAAPPDGSRTIRGRINAQADLVLCGDTAVSAGLTRAFTEPVQQVLQDVQLGAKYYVRSKNELLQCLVSGNVLATSNGPLTLASLPDLAGDARPWADWWALCQDDSEYYRRQRQPA